MRLSRSALAVLALALLGPALLVAQEPLAAGSEGVPVPKKKKHVQPVYPSDALAQGIRGIVILDLVIDTEGQVAETNIIRSIPGLDEAALDAVTQWTYEPVKVDGKPVSVRLTVPITFALKLPQMTRQPGIPPLRQGVTPPWPASNPEGGTAVADITLEPDGRIGLARILEGADPWSTALLQALRTWRFSAPPDDATVSFQVAAEFIPGRGRDGDRTVRLDLRSLREAALFDAPEEPGGDDAVDAARMRPIPESPPPPTEGTPAPPQTDAPAPAAPPPAPETTTPAAQDDDDTAGAASPTPAAAPAPAPPTPGEAAGPAPVAAAAPQPEPAPAAAVPPEESAPRPAPPAAPPAPPADSTPTTPPPPSAQTADLALARPAGEAEQPSEAEEAAGIPLAAPLDPTAPPPVETLSAAPPPLPPENGISAIRGVELEPGVPDLIRGRRPVSPPLARMVGAGGLVQVDFSLSAGGIPTIQRSDGPDILTPAASNAVESWVFRRTRADRAYLTAVFTYEDDLATAVVRPQAQPGR